MDLNPQDIEHDDIVGDVLIRILSSKVIDDPGASKEKKDTAPPQYLQCDFRSDEVLYVCAAAEKSFMKQEVLLEIERSMLPIHVVADLHGQVPHALRLFRTLGSPQKETYLFLGDYVDRGVQGVELMLLLLCSKIRYPFQVFLLRGNHEDVNANLNYGFYEECLLRFNTIKNPNMGEKIWLSFLSAFNCMPMAAVVSGRVGRVFCCHGGISPFLEKLEDINKIQRPNIIPAFGAACDLVWSDPAPTAGWALSHRGISFTFGSDVLERFCQKHNIDVVLRGHQINEKMYRSGYKMNPGGRLMTFFSAPNYMNYRNNGCVIKISDGLRLSVIVFRVKTDPVPKKKSSLVAAFMKRKQKIQKPLVTKIDKEGEIDTEVDIANSRESLDEQKKKMSELKKNNAVNNNNNTKSNYQTVKSTAISYTGSSFQPTISVYGQPVSEGKSLMGQPCGGTKSVMGAAPVAKNSLMGAAPGAKNSLMGQVQVRKKDSKPKPRKSPSNKH